MTSYNRSAAWRPLLAVTLRVVSAGNSRQSVSIFTWQRKTLAARHGKNYPSRVQRSRVIISPHCSVIVEFKNRKISSSSFWCTVSLTTLNKLLRHSQYTEYLHVSFAVTKQIWFIQETSRTVFVKCNSGWSSGCQYTIRQRSFGPELCFPHSGLRGYCH